MKRMITLLLALMMLMTACGGKQPENEKRTTEEQLQQPQTVLTIDENLSAETVQLTETPENLCSEEIPENQGTEKPAQPEGENHGKPGEVKPTEPAPTEPNAPKPAEPTPAPTEPAPAPTEPAPAPTEPAQPQENENGLPVLPEGTVHMRVGDTLDLCAGYSGTKKLSWKSSKKAAATVSGSGVVTAKAVGFATITVSDGKNKSLCTIEVHTGMVEILCHEMRLLVGQTTGLEHKYYGKGSLTWRSSDPDIASVSANGALTTKKRGKVTISLTDGVDTAKCTVTVTETDNVLTISTQHPVFVGETLQMDYTYYGSDLRPLQWRSSNTAILTVDGKGLMTGVAAGTAVVSCTDGDVSWDWKVEVRNQSEKSQSIYFQNRVRFFDGVTRFKGDTMRLLVGARPNSNVDVKVTTSDASVAHVKFDTDPQYASPYFYNYLVTFKKAGKVVLTLETQDGCIKEKYTINVKATYDCDPGKSKLTPGEFSYCATRVGAENGQKAATVLSGYRYMYLRDDELTWARAKAVGESLAKEWYGIRIGTILVTYAGWSEEHNMHLFYIGY